MGSCVHGQGSSKLVAVTRSSPGRKVAVVFHDGGLNGASLSVLRTLPLLERRGWRFAFWGPPASPLSEYLEEHGYPLHGAPREIGYSLVSLRQPPGVRARLASLPGYLRDFRRFLRAESPQLVHANTLYTLAEAMVARASGVPALLHLHEMVPESYKGAVSAGLCRRAGIEVVAVSRASAMRYARGGTLPRVVHEGASVADAPPPRLPDGRVVVGTIGVISRRKGTDLFVEAARRVRRQSERVDFRLVGSPTDPLDEAWGRRVLREARGAGIEHRDRVDVPAELADWHVFVLPARRDPFPIVVLEAMANGLPVVGTAVDGIPEQITTETGLVCEPDDPDALATAILNLVRDPKARESMGASGRRRVMEHFTVERQAEGLHEAYMAALRRAGPSVAAQR